MAYEAVYQIGEADFKLFITMSPRTWYTKSLDLNGIEHDLSG